jgi:hypothetical protein
MSLFSQLNLHPSPSLSLPHACPSNWSSATVGGTAPCTNLASFTHPTLCSFRGASGSPCGTGLGEDAAPGDGGRAPAAPLAPSALGSVLEASTSFASTSLMKTPGLEGKTWKDSIWIRMDALVSSCYANWRGADDLDHSDHSAG